MRIGICGNYGVFNIGDELILSGLKLTLQKAYPQSEFAVFGQGNLFPLGIRSFFKAIFRHDLWSKPYRELKSCDMFILGGGGLFSDEEGAFVPIFWALHGLIAAWLKKPVYCLGISISVSGFLNERVCKKLFKKSKFITVRDKNSFKLLQKWGIASRLLSDFATMLPFDNRQNSIDSEPYIIFSLRPFIKNNDTLYTILAQFCDWLVDTYGLNIKLMPFQKGGQFDDCVLNTIFDRSQHKSKIKIERFIEDVDELNALVSRARLVIGMRLHAGIVSIMSGTPFMPLAYMQKVSDFWSEFPEIKPVKLEDISLGNLINDFTYIWNNMREKRDVVGKIRQHLLNRAKETEKFVVSTLK